MELTKERKYWNVYDFGTSYAYGALCSWNNNFFCSNKQDNFDGDFAIVLIGVHDVIFDSLERQSRGNWQSICRKMLELLRQTSGDEFIHFHHTISEHDIDIKCFEHVLFL
jgi:hypothetical protein